MSKSKKLIHGERNKLLSKELIDGKKFYDWVITTAFYSSIHLLEHKILPETINSKTCSNISHVRRAYNSRGRHEAREKLVVEFTDHNIASRYKWLDDKSRYSRYTTYKIPADQALKAEQYLNEIYKYCI